MTELGTGTAPPPAALSLLESPREAAGLSLTLGPLVGVGSWGKGGHLQVAWASSMQVPMASEPEAQDGIEPSALGMGILSGQRPNTHQPYPLPIPGQPALSSIDESNPLYYNKLHLPLPITPPSPTLSQWPSLLHPLAVAGAPPQAVPLPVSSQVSWHWPESLGDAEGEAALLLQVDIFCGAGVLHKLLVELLKCSPRRQTDTHAD